MTLESIEEWLNTWGDGPNWADKSGACVPITKETLHTLLTGAKRMRTALQELRERVLPRAPGSAREFSPATAASIATICDDAIEGM